MKTNVSKGIVALLLFAGSITAVYAQEGDSLDSLLGPTPQNQPTSPPTPKPGDTVPEAAAKANQPASAITPKPEAEATPTAKTKPVASVPKAPTQAAAGPKGGNRLIEEIVVTAEKRAENVQNVPIAVSAFSGGKLDALGIKSADQLPQITPGLTFTGTAGYTIIFLRGVGTDAFLPSADLAVPIYLDGVALQAGHGVVNTLGRVERVEVLKGPQGTLFGRNSTGGAIQIITPEPGPDFGGDAQVEFGNYGTLNEQLFLNVPIVDGLGATIAAYSQRNTSYTQNQTGPTIDTYSRGGRVKLVWHATDNLSFNGSAIYGEESGNNSTATENIHVAPILSGLGILVPQDPKADRRVSEDFVPGTVLSSSLFSAGLDWRLPWVELKLTLATQHIGEPYVAYDYDASTTPIASFYSTSEFFTQRSGELQIQSRPDTPFSNYFEWTAGAYVLQGKGGFPVPFIFQVADSGFLNLLPGGQAFSNSLNGLITSLGTGISSIPVLTGPVTLYNAGLLTTRSLSGYFQGRVHLNELFGLSQRLNLILGARLDRETRGLDESQLGFINPATNQPTLLLPFFVPDVQAIQVPLKAELQWFPFDFTQVYVSWSRGFTAPTYDTVNFFSDPKPLQPSKVDTYELGLKTQLLDQSLTFDAALFYTREHELLSGFVSLGSGGIANFSNVPAARIYGAEFDATWQALPELDPGLALVASASYLNTKYTDYPDGYGYDTTTGLAYGPPGLVDTGRNFTGNRIVRTPRYSYQMGINQNLPLNDASRVELNVSMYYNDGFSFLPQNTSNYITPSYRLIDAHVSYFYKPWGIEVTGFGNNLTQEKYFTSIFGTDFGSEVALNPPRTYGLRLKYTF